MIFDQISAVLASAAAVVVLDVLVRLVPTVKRASVIVPVVRGLSKVLGALADLLDKLPNNVKPQA